MNEPPVLSVVIPAYDGRSFIEGCLEGHARQAARAGVEWIVAVSGDDGTAEWVAEHHPAVRLVKSPSRINASEARNRGVAVARGAWFAFTDVDVLVPPDWTARILRRVAEGHPAFCGTVANGTPRSRIGTADYFLCFGEYIPSARAIFGRRRVIGANLIVSRRAWCAAGPMDVDLPRGQDTEYGCRLRDSGFPPALFGEIEVTHLNRTDRDRYLAGQAMYGRAAATLRLRGHTSLGAVVRHPALMPLIPAYRLAALLSRVLRYRRGDLPALLKSLPDLCAGLCSYTRAFRATVMDAREPKVHLRTCQSQTAVARQSVS